MQTITHRSGVPTALSFIIGFVCLSCTCTGPASVAPQHVDLSPLWEVQPDLSKGLAQSFSDFEAIVVNGLQESDGSPRKDGVVELRTKDYSEIPGASRDSRITARVMILDSPERAVEFLRHDCAFAGETFPDSNLEIRQHGNWRSCVSPIAQLRNDAEGGFIPSKDHISIVLLQHDRLFIDLHENYRGEAKTSKNTVISEIAERLSPRTTQ